MPDEILTGDAGTPTPTPAPDPTPAAATPAAPITPTPAIAAPVPESRENWVPPHRLREATEQHRQAQAQWQAQDAQYKAQLTQLQRQRDALAGIAPPEDPEDVALRQQFAQKFPKLARLEEAGIEPEQINAFLQRAGQIEAQQQHYWNSYATQTMDKLFDRASQSLGGPLNEQAKDVLHNAFSSYVQRSPELMQRYASDPSLIEEFWTAFSSAFIEPTRRAAATNVANRAVAPIPRDTTGGLRVTPAPPVQSMDERLNAGWSMYNQTAKK